MSIAIWVQVIWALASRVSGAPKHTTSMAYRDERSRSPPCRLQGEYGIPLRLVSRAPPIGCPGPTSTMNLSYRFREHVLLSVPILRNTDGTSRLPFTTQPALVVAWRSCKNKIELRCANGTIIEMG